MIDNYSRAKKTFTSDRKSPFPLHTNPYISEHVLLV